MARGGRYALHVCDHPQSVSYDRNIAVYRENPYTSNFDKLYFAATNNCGQVGLTNAGGDYLEFYAEHTGILWVATRETFSNGSNCNARNRIDRRRPDGHINFRQFDNITAQVGNQDALCGDDVTFTVNASVDNGNVPEFSYQWQVNDGSGWRNLSGESGMNLQIRDVQASQFGSRYRARVALDQVRHYSDSGQLLEAAVDPPSNVRSSSDNCSGEVEITWEWYLSNPLMFLIEFSTDGGNNWSDLVEVSGSDRSYLHEGVTRGQDILYRMRTYSDTCERYTSSSSPAEGISPLEPLPPIHIDAVVMDAEGGKLVRISFEDTSDNEEGFYVDKMFENGTIDRYTINSDSTQKDAVGGRRFYDDLEVANCEPYSYRAYSHNVCSEEGVRATGELAAATVNESIEDVIFLDALEASKGYYTDRVDLEWRFNPMGQYAYVSRYKIYTRGLGSDDTPQLLNSQTRDVLSWDHTSSNASYLYEYFVVAEGECGDQIITSFDIEGMDPTVSFPDNLPMQGVAYDIGFRSPAGIINGSISYQGGVAVPDVKVLVERDSEAIGYALHFDGVDDYVDFPASSYLEEVHDVFSLSLWLRPGDLAETAVPLSLSGIITVTIDAGILSFNVKDAARVMHTVSLDDPLALEQYANLFVTYDQGAVKMYLNGTLAKEQDLSPLVLDDNLGYLYLGGVPNTADPATSFFNGHIDEVRLYAQVMEADRVLRDYSRYVESDGDGIVGYWKINEGKGPYVFDIANELGLYHGSDGRIFGATWSDEIPDASQLGMAGYTDENGHYQVNEILFRDNGENFTVTPSITLSGSIHAFSPNQRVLFIGVGNASLNDVAFTDVSSFEVSGHVLFEYDGVRSGSEGVAFYLDGGTPLVRSDGTLITTDAFGYFEIQIPIGLHFFQARKAFHEFENEGRFPSLSPTYDFQDLVTGVEIIDTTRRRLIGRVVGGTREGDKPVGFNKSVNNIGTASFVLVATDNTFSIPVAPDPESNEYLVEIPPKKYNVYRVTPPNQLGINVNQNPLAEDFFQGLEAVDLTDKVVVQVSSDTLYTDDDPPVVDEILEVPYHLKKNYVYRSIPSVAVEDGSPGGAGASFAGEEFIVYQSTAGIEDTIQLNYGAGGIPFPVFDRQTLSYAARIKLQERYVNLDDPANPVEDLVPVSDGTLNIFNYLGRGFYLNEHGTTATYASGPAGIVPDVIPIEEEDNGEAFYQFTLSEPSVSLNTADQSLSFTKTMQITARAGGNVVYWPGPAEQDVFRAYVFGGAPDGSSFISEGPDVVDFILRDPPGSGSSAYISADRSLTQSHSFSLNVGMSYDLVSQVGFGLSTVTGTVGPGVLQGTINSTSSTFDLGLHFSSGVGYGGQWVETYTTQETFSTSGSSGLVGAEGDVYVGKAQNFQYGISQFVTLVPSSDCARNEVACPFAGTGITLTGDSGEDYQVGLKVGLHLDNGGNPTMFAYTEKHIEGILLPRLETLRNTLIAENEDYVSHRTPDHALYGSNNDDPAWEDEGEVPSTESPFSTQQEDFTGPSYTFTPGQMGEEIDSIRWYNQQIRLWKEAIANNERAKLEAMQYGDPTNVSFGAGSPYSASTTTSSQESHSFALDLSLGADIGVSNTVEILGTSVHLSLSVGLQVSTSYNFQDTESESRTFGYSLSDSDSGDFLSVGVYDGGNNNGPIFLITDGGETSCPYEDAYLTKYHQPGTELSPATLQRQKARLEVQVPEVFNIPSEEAANFIVIMNNESESGDDFDYTLSVVDESNPNGASLFVDGAYFDERRTFSVPGGGAIQKIITMERGAL